jgi:hypothetical protein
VNTKISKLEAYASLHSNLLIGIHCTLCSLAARLQVISGYYEFALCRGFSYWCADNLVQYPGLKLELHGFGFIEGPPLPEVDNHRNLQAGRYAGGLEQVMSWLEQWRMPPPHTLQEGWNSAELLSGIEKRHAVPAPGCWNNPTVIPCHIQKSPPVFVRSPLRSI